MKIKGTITWISPTDGEWILGYTFRQGHPGTYEDPPEGDEIEWDSNVVCKEPKTSAARSFVIASFDDFVGWHGIDDKGLMKLEELAIEDANDRIAEKFEEP